MYLDPLIRLRFAQSPSPRRGEEGVRLAAVSPLPSGRGGERSEPVRGPNRSSNQFRVH